MTAARDPPSKPDLRAAMRERRRDLAALNPAAAEEAAANLPLGELPPATVVSGYHALADEMNPWPTLQRFAQRGARIVLPVTLGREQPLVFRAWTFGDPLEPDAARIPAPTATAQELIPQIVIAPLLAFDRQGYRLGQGAGYYDRTLAGLRGRPVFVIGLAYAGQEVARAPREAHDQPVDAILTETGYHRVREDMR